MSKIFGVPLALIVLVVTIVVPISIGLYMNYLVSRATLLELRSWRSEGEVVEVFEPVVEVPVDEAETASPAPTLRAVSTPVPTAETQATE